MRSSLTILLFFALGTMVGIFNFAPSYIVQNDLSHWALYLLMLLVGIGIGADPSALKAVKALNFRIALVPLFTIVGTTLGVLLVYLILPMFNLTDMLAIGYGFGYYSLSSIFIANIRGEELGVVALLANIMREIITLLFAPIFATLFGKLSPIVSGGATSMDTTLPIITKSSGKDYAMVSLIHGVILTILVPFLVTLVLGLHS
ncbi:MAG TPA: lysine exporter LysO family protein [Bacteroidetes bacterium]|nr:lysine exporter LysO family protein [Bacteroidota bacterium]